MRRVFKVCSKIMAFVYAFICSIMKKKTPIANNCVLIIATGHIGNAILDIDAILEMKRFFLNEGKKVYLLCSPTMWNIFQILADVSDFEYIGENYRYSGNGTDFKNVYRTLKSLKQYEFEKVIVTLTNDPVAHYVVASIPFNESYGVFDDVKHIDGFFRYYFERYYTKKVKVPVDMHEFQRLKMLIQLFGEKDYKTAIHYIQPQTLKTNTERQPYITIAMDSMCTQRRWKKEQYALLVDNLLRSYPYDIYCTGGTLANEVYHYCYERIKDKNRFFNFAAKTTVIEWFELIRGAVFHIGVDSGSIHVAASVGTQAFCLVGVWDGKRALPYVTDKEDKRTCSPVCVYREDINDLKCYACKVYGGRYGVGNTICYKTCQKGEACLCLQRITYLDVLNKIKNFFDGDINVQSSETV